LASTSTSSADVQFITDSECIGNGRCAQIPALNPAVYLQTKRGIVSTAGYTDIYFQLSFTLTNWAYLSTLSILWKPDGDESVTNQIEEYDHDDLTQNQLHSITYDLSSASNAANNPYFAVVVEASYSGNSAPILYLHDISVFGTKTPTTAPTPSPTAEPTHRPTVDSNAEAIHTTNTSDTLFVDQEAYTGTIRHPINVYVVVAVVFSVVAVGACCVLMHSQHRKRTRGSSEGRMPPGLVGVPPSSAPQIRLNTEGTIDDDDVLLQDGNGNRTPLETVSPDGYPATRTGSDEGHYLDPDEVLNIDIVAVDSDEDLDKVENDVIVVLSSGHGTVGSVGTLRNGNVGRGNDDDVVQDIDAMVNVAKTVGTDVGERLISEPGDELEVMAEDEIVDGNEDVEEFEVIGDGTAGTGN